MNPFKTALWIAKFVGALALLLVVIPYGLFLGGAWAVSGVAEKYQEHKLGIYERDVETCVRRNGEAARLACDTNPKIPIISESLLCVGKSTPVPAFQKDIEDWCSYNPSMPLVIHSTHPNGFDIVGAEGEVCRASGGDLSSEDNFTTCHKQR